MALLLVFVLGHAASSELEEQVIITLAGPAECGPDSVDGNSRDCRFSFPDGIAFDSNGAMYVADRANCTIRKISARGEVSTLAGLAGAPGSSDGCGDRARFRAPRGVATDEQGYVIIADTGNHTIRKIAPDGTAVTLSGLAGEAGDKDGPVGEARFREPAGVAIDSQGFVYVADRGNATVRRITLAGLVDTLAGIPGKVGCKDGVAGESLFRDPTGITVTPSGTIYVADTGNHVVRKISPEGLVSTLAGRVGAPGQVDGPGNRARFFMPTDLVAGHDGTVYVVDSLNGAVRRIGADRTVSTMTKATSLSASARTTSRQLTLLQPQRIALGLGGTLWVSDTSNHRVCRLYPDGQLAVSAGQSGAYGHADGEPANARFYTPSSLAVDRQSNVYVVDRGTHVLRLIDPSGFVRTLAGSPGHPGKANGIGSKARFRAPQGVCVGSDGFIYVGDTGNHVIRRVDADGRVETWAGWAGNSGLRNRRRSSALFRGPAGLAFNAAGDLFVADTGNACIRRISAAGEVSTLAILRAPLGSLLKSRPGVGQPEPTDVAVDSAGKVYAADRGTHSLWCIDPGGQVRLLAGQPGDLGARDGQGQGARFGSPRGLGMNAGGMMYVADAMNHTVLLVGSDGLTSTWGGKSHEPGSSNGGLSVARFFSPSDVAVGPDGRIYVADAENHSVRTTASACPDHPTIDQQEGPIAVARRLDVAPRSASHVLWRVVRRPANSTARVEGPDMPRTDFTPDVPGLYILELQARTIDGKVSIRRLEFRGN